MTIGFKEKVELREAGYNALTEIQQMLYDEAQKEFEESKQRIDNAKKKADLKMVKERTIVVDRLARKVSILLGKPINHSHVSKQNCLFLFQRIKRWNSKLIALYEASEFASKPSKTKDEIKKELAEAKAAALQKQREVDVAELNALVDALLLPAQAEMKNQIALLKNENQKLHEKIAELESQREMFLEQVVSDLETQKIKQDNIRLRTLLAKHDINF